MKELYLKYINKLEIYFNIFESKIDSPNFLNNNHNRKFRYSNPTRIEILIMKSARYISGLNASILLLYEGYIQELGAICRILKEIYDDVLFLFEGYPSHPLTEDQHHFINEFLQEEFDIPENPLKSTQKRNRVSRKNIFKSLGRLFSYFTPYDKAKELHRTIYYAYSGYIHCAYPHIMEIYGGNPPKYHLRGMKGTPRIKEWEDNMKSFIHQGINLFLEISQIMNLSKEEHELRKLRTNFESEANYLVKKITTRPNNSLQRTFLLRRKAAELKRCYEK